MDAAVQELVDRLALRLRRPALLEDRFHRTIAHSPHDGPTDPVRTAAILRRHGSAEVIRWLHSAGLRRAHGPVRVPANPELGMLARVCLPVRHRDVLLGYLWFVDPEQSVPMLELERCQPEVAELAALLHRASVAGVPARGAVAEALRALLADSPRAGAAARRLTDADLIGRDGGVVVVVVQPPDGLALPVTTVERAVTEAVLTSPQLSRRGTALHLARRDHSVLLVRVPPDEPWPRPALESLHATATALVAATAPGAGLVVGVGGERPGLERLAGSYREARLAAMVGGALPALGPVVEWQTLGAYQVVAELAAGDAPERLPHPGLRALLDAPEALPLLETLETYLDLAGNARLTAERLHLHRTSLYYRLQRVEQLTGADLKDGMQRLALHLSLKVARLTGRYAPRTSLTRPAQPEADPGLNQVA